MKTVLALAIVLSINVFLFLGQMAVNDINPGQAPQFFNADEQLIGDFDAGNYTLNENITDKLPGGEGSVSPTTGNVFTDLFSTMKNWFLESTGLNYLVAIINAVPNFLKIIGLPKEFVFAIGFFWHAITLFLVINFIKGGE